MEHKQEHTMYPPHMVGTGMAAPTWQHPYDQPHQNPMQLHASHPHQTSTTSLHSHQALSPSRSTASFHPSVAGNAASVSFSHSPSTASIQTMASLNPSHATSRAPLLRGNISLKDRVALDNLQAHHTNLKRAIPAVRSWHDHTAHITLARNHVAAVQRNQALREQEVARQNTQLVVKIAETVVKGRSPYSVNSARQPFTHKSLNLTQRKKEQARIAAANLLLAKRIVEKKAEVGARGEWEKHATRHDRIAQNISRYIDVNESERILQKQMQDQLIQQQQLQFARAAALGVPLPPEGLPPGYTIEMYIEALQQLQLQGGGQPHQPLAQSDFDEHGNLLQQQQQQQQPLQPVPPAHPRGSTPTTSVVASVSAPSSSSSGGGSGGPLQPLPDGQKRSARLSKKLLAMERDKFGPSSSTERLLRPLRRRSQQGDGSSAAGIASLQHQQQQQQHQQYPSQQPLSHRTSAQATPARRPSVSSHTSSVHSQSSTLQQPPQHLAQQQLYQQQLLQHQQYQNPAFSNIILPHADADASAAAADGDNVLVISPNPEPILVLRKSKRASQDHVEPVVAQQQQQQLEEEEKQNSHHQQEEEEQEEEAEAASESTEL